MKNICYVMLMIFYAALFSFVASGLGERFLNQYNHDEKVGVDWRMAGVKVDSLIYYVPQYRISLKSTKWYNVKRHTVYIWGRGEWTETWYLCFYTPERCEKFLAKKRGI